MEGILLQITAFWQDFRRNSANIIIPHYNITNFNFMYLSDLCRKESLHETPALYLAQKIKENEIIMRQ